MTSPADGSITGLRKERPFAVTAANTSVRLLAPYERAGSARKPSLAARCSMAPGYRAGVQVLGLRTPSTTSRIVAMTSSGWSWWMLWPLLVAMA
jgi:hypothetical protein